MFFLDVLFVFLIFRGNQISKASNFLKEKINILDLKPKDEVILDLIDQMIQIDPKKRVQSSNLLSHKLFENYSEFSTNVILDEENKKLFKRMNKHQTLKEFVKDLLNQSK